MAPWRPIVPNQIEPNPNRPPSPPPRAGSLSPPTAPKAQPLAPSLPLARGGFASPGSGGCVEVPTACAPRGRKPAGFSRGKGTRGFALRLRLMGVVFFVAVKSEGGGKRTRFLETRFRKFSRQKGAGPLPLMERKRGANSASRRKWSRARYHLILDNQKKDS